MVNTFYMIKQYATCEPWLAGALLKCVDGEADGLYQGQN
jgi:hypothetical protein